MASEDRKMEVEEPKTEEVEKKAEEKQEEKKDEGPSVLDLAFAMDCTGSMGSYINQARQNIRTIVEEIVSAEKADVRLALVEYRDHPPQDSSFVTRVHDFTPSVKTMKGWLDGCNASGGGDGPEAVADAMHQVLKLSWRDEAAKICVFISDAPPHGLSASCGDGFPNGCPDGLDPMVTANEIGEKGIVMYMVGCEPSITPYRDWFMAVAHITNGQYVPLANSALLAKVIIGGAQEEIALQRLLEEVNREVQQEAQVLGGGEHIDEEDLTRRVHSKHASRGVQSKQLQMNCMALEGASSFGKNLASHKTMADVKRDMDKNMPSPGFGFSFGGPPPPPSVPGRFDGMSAPLMGSTAPTALFGSHGPPPPPPGSSGGFTFGAPPPPRSSSGFTFGAPAAPASSGSFLSAQSGPSGGFTFGARPPPPISSGGFQCQQSTSTPQSMCVPVPMASFGATPHDLSGPAPTSSSSFGVATQDIDYAQTSRVVSKAMKMNKFK